MWQRGVIIENLPRCPPISHPSCPGRHSPLQLNVPRKQDKTVINAKSLCLLSCSGKGQCHCPLACSQRVQNKEKMETRIGQVCCCSGISHQPLLPMLIGHVYENMWCNRIVNHPHICIFVFPCSHVFCAYTLSFNNTNRCKEGRFTEKTISQSEWHESTSNRVVMPHSHPDPLFVCLFCRLVVVVVLLKFQGPTRTELKFPQCKNGIKW